MKKRLIILLGILGLFFGGLLALPSAPQMKPSRLAKQLPSEFGVWLGKPREPSEAEKQKLAKDTEFERMEYHDRYDNLSPIEVSIVFSGKNLSQSIHRPQVCMRAQGWEFLSEKFVTMKDVLPGGTDMPMKELICRMPRMLPPETPEGKPRPVLTSDGKQSYIWKAFYYTFFGHEKIVPGHYERTLEDMKDRIFQGHDQRWAYATFSTYITQKFVDQDPNIFEVNSWELRDEAETKEHVRVFLKELLPKVVAEPKQGFDESLKDGKILGL